MGVRQLRRMVFLKTRPYGEAVFEVMLSLKIWKIRKLRMMEKITSVDFCLKYLRTREDPLLVTVIYYCPSPLYCPFFVHRHNNEVCLVLCL